MTSSGVYLSVIDANDTVVGTFSTGIYTIGPYGSKTTADAIFSGSARWPLRLSGRFLGDEFEPFSADGDPYVAFYTHENKSSGLPNSVQIPTGIGSVSGSLPYAINNIQPSGAAWAFDFVSPPLSEPLYTNGAIHAIVRCINN